MYYSSFLFMRIYEKVLIYISEQIIYQHLFVVPAYKVWYTLHNDLVKYIMWF
jgi:hypothetical protein